MPTEFWTIGNKAAVLGYVITASFLADPTSAVSPWHILAYLLYLAINITIPIFNKINPKRLLAAGSATFVIFATYSLEPLFVLLLPVNVCELVSLLWKRRPIALGGVLLPAWFVPPDLIPLYLLIGLLGYLLYACGWALSDKLEKLEAEREKMREDLQQLKLMLSETTNISGSPNIRSSWRSETFNVSLMSYRCCLRMVRFYLRKRELNNA